MAEALSRRVAEQAGADRLGGWVRHAGCVHWHDTPMRHPDDLRSIPGVGPSIAADLRPPGRRGGRRPRRAATRSSSTSSSRSCDGEHVDRCVLYVFRAAVHHARRRERRPGAREVVELEGRRPRRAARPRLGAACSAAPEAPQPSASALAPEPGQRRAPAYRVLAAPQLYRRRSSRTPPAPGRPRSSTRG